MKPSVGFPGWFELEPHDTMLRGDFALEIRRGSHPMEFYGDDPADGEIVVGYSGRLVMNGWDQRYYRVFRRGPCDGRRTPPNPHFSKPLPLP